ncbi:MAG: YdcF family protein [Nitrospirae bacterium]|nr:YdcF family protein [Nitrospirota bacterium]
MFLLKKITASFFLPLSLVLIFSLPGLLFLLFTSRQKLGKALITAGIALLVLFSFGTAPDILIGYLEDRYPPISDDVFTSGHAPKLIVVLGGGHSPGPRFPVTSRIGYDSLTRLIEGIRIYRRIEGSKLVLSGGAPFGKIPVADTMAEAARSMGVDARDIITESKSRDTEDEAVILKPVLGHERFILVTSASHMPRSMALFKSLDMDPLPAPAMHLVHEKDHWSPDICFPSSAGLHKLELASHEYLGLLWLKVRGKI